MPRVADHLVSRSVLESHHCAHECAQTDRVTSGGWKTIWSPCGHSCFFASANQRNEPLEQFVCTHSLQKDHWKKFQCLMQQMGLWKLECQHTNMSHWKCIPSGGDVPIAPTFKFSMSSFLAHQHVFMMMSGKHRHDSQKEKTQTFLDILAFFISLLMSGLNEWSQWS